ncbi:hypothetical protein UF13_04550 [Pantoea agglomerans]|nr:hypothetical protein UF13_04550 [Pantoea agglomerans]
MVEFIVLIIAIVSGIASAHFNCKAKGIRDFKAFMSLCLGGAVLGTIMLFSFLAPMWASYTIAAFCIVILINSISEFKKSLVR